MSRLVIISPYLAHPRLEALLSHLKMTGTRELLFLLFFSTLAFTVMENSMPLIFFHRKLAQRRHYLIPVTFHSAKLPERLLKQDPQVAAHGYLT